MGARRDRGKPSTRRRALLAGLREAGRRHSDAAVLLHGILAERMGLGATEEKTLSILERLGPLSAGEIARHTGLANASVTNLVDRLESKGFVRRVRDGKDRRRVLVELRPERAAEFLPLFASLAPSIAKLFSPYADSELQVILDFLKRDTERMRAATARLQKGAWRGSKSP